MFDRETRMRGKTRWQLISNRHDSPTFKFLREVGPLISLSGAWPVAKPISCTEICLRVSFKSWRSHARRLSLTSTIHLTGS